MSASATTTRPSRARTLVHPGRFDPVRIRSLCSTRGRHVRLALTPGKSLFDALVQPLAEIGIASASTTILGGDLDDVRYCVAAPGASGQAVAVYSQPIWAGRSYVVFGNATIGRGMTGAPLVHCHATIRTEAGEVKGGHILTETCIVGPRPIPVLVTSLDDFELRQAFDPETNIPLFRPFEAVRHE